MIETVIVAVTSGGLAGSLALLWRAKAQNRKDDADAAATITDAAGRLVERLDDQIKDLTSRLEKANEELTQLRAETRGLLAEVNECRRQHPPLRRVH